MEARLEVRGPGWLGLYYSDTGWYDLPFTVPPPVLQSVGWSHTANAVHPGFHTANRTHRWKPFGDVPNLANTNATYYLPW